MASKTRIARLVQRRGNLPLALNKAVVFNPDGTTVMSGLLVEGTPYKDTVYIYHYVQAFFMEQDRIILSYSKRLASDSGRDFFEGTDEQIADRCLQVLENTGMRDRVVEPMSEQGFIAHIEQGQVLGRDWRTELDLGAACAIMGDLGGAGGYLAKARQEFEERLPGRRPFTSDTAFRSTLDGLETMLVQAPGELAGAIRQRARQNAAKLGFVLKGDSP